MSNLIELLSTYPALMIGGFVFAWIVILASLRDPAIFPALAFILHRTVYDSLVLMGIDIPMFTFFLPLTILVLFWAWHPYRFVPLLKLNRSHVFLLLWLVVLFLGIRFTGNPAPQSLTMKKGLYLIGYLIAPWYLGWYYAETKTMDRVCRWLLFFFGLCSVVLLVSSLTTFGGDARLGMEENRQIGISQKAAMTLLIFACYAFFVARKRNLFLISLLVMIMSMGILVSTASRGPILTVCLVFFIVMFLFGKFTLRTLMPAALGMTVIVGAMIAFLPDAQKDLLLQRFDTKGVSAEEFSNGRYELYETALKMTYEKPVLGYGIASYSMFPPSWLANKPGNKSGDKSTVMESGASLFRPHNVPLEVLCENGICGFLCFVGILFCGAFQFMALIRSRHDDGLTKYLAACLLLGYFFMMQTSGALYSYPLFWLMLGFLAGRNSPEPSPVLKSRFIRLHQRRKKIYHPPAPGTQYWG